MINFQILTLFPELFTSFKEAGLVGRGVRDGHLGIETIHLRDFAVNTHGQVDDTPYGGGSGLVLKTETTWNAINAAKEKDPNTTVALFSPRGKVFNQEQAKGLLEKMKQKQGGLTFICPRYEGVDERVRDWVDEEISLGDFVLMGGEVAAMAVIETISRFVPEVLGNPESLKDESFTDDLLEYPQYTKPQEFQGVTVPEVLLSGNHQEIATWRQEKRIEETVKLRPEFFNKVSNSEADISVALIHHPVVNKKGEEITSSITNLDLHDIARSAKTFGLERFYVIHPTKALRRLAEKILEHWDTGYGSRYNENRKEALKTISVVPDFDDALTDIELRTGNLPKIITTSARASSETISYETGRAILQTTKEPHLLLLGTGWGLSDSLMKRADYRLEPVYGSGDYNHLSVRSAAAIIFSRLFGR